SVEVTSSPIIKALGLKQISIKSNPLTSMPTITINGLIKQNSSVFIREYGYGAVSTISIRGGAGRHTSILWEGVPISYPTLGLVDLSILPAGFFDEVKVNIGGATALYGNGAMNGSINLTEGTLLNTSLKGEINGSFGSFSSFGGLAKVQQGGARFGWKVMIYGNKAENDFQINSRGERLKNAQKKLTGIAATAVWNPLPKFYSKTGIWVVNGVRGIPPIKSNPADTLGRLTDKNFRVNQRFSYFLNQKTTFYYTVGLQFNQLNYADPRANIDSEGSSQEVLNKIEVKRAVSKYIMANAELNYRHQRGDIAQFLGFRTRQVYRGAFNFSFERNRIKLKSAASADYLNQFSSTPGIYLGAEFKLLNPLILNASISRNYTIPTLNDLYWNPGGNPNLLPEEGWHYESGLAYSVEKENLTISLNGNVFFGIIENWIVWTPTIAGFWSPKNLQEVENKGFEYGITSALSQGGNLYSMSFNYTFNKVSKIGDNPSAEVKQVIYTPYESAQGKVSWERKSIALAVDYRFTGFLFIDEENEGVLDAYGLLGLSLGYKWRSFKIALRADNITNVDYEPLPGRYVPGQNYSLNLGYTF
ncbi:MAG: vitamin B12 transporter, partial [Sphingobacteriales bacterium]